MNISEKNELLEIALHLDSEILLSRADTLRRAVFGNKIELCAILNARSGNCSMDCRFCSQSRHNATSVSVFSLLSDVELREKTAALFDLPVRHVGIVTSGGALGGDEFIRLRSFIASLPEKNRARLCASLGRLSQEQLQELQNDGLIRFHHNLETSENFYPQVCTTQRWRDRLETARSAKKAGLELCCGGLFGMGESWEDRINFALFLRENEVSNIPMNFLHPHPHTPLGNNKPLNADEALRIIAIFRLVLPNATLRVCGGRPITFGSRHAEIFRAGANALMVGDYLTTRGMGLSEDIKMIEKQNLRVE